MSLLHLSGISASFNPANPIITIKSSSEALYPNPADDFSNNFDAAIKIMKSRTDPTANVISRDFLFIIPQVLHQLCR